MCKRLEESELLTGQLGILLHGEAEVEQDVPFHLGAGAQVWHWPLEIGFDWHLHTAQHNLNLNLNALQPVASYLGFISWKLVMIFVVNIRMSLSHDKTVLSSQTSIHRHLEP